MIKTRLRQFQRAHDLLLEVKDLASSQPDSYPTATPKMIIPLMALHRLLIREITRAERKVRRTKNCLKMVENERDQHEASLLSERLEGYRHLAYNWRCFGDAVAFLFMDKFSLKQTFYNTHNTSPKQDAGFLIGKTGLQLELEILDTYLNNGIPALLTDVTNSIRYGDVVLMVGPNPMLVEVKSGNTDRRGKRQLKSIRQLNEFFATDEAKDFRGFEKLSRVAHKAEEVNYVDAINDCISEAMKSGFSWRGPEEGLHYLVIADDVTDISDVMKEMDLNRPIAFFLNEAKANRLWSPYSPYTLSIRDPEALFQFVWGGLIIVVFYDLDVLKRLVEREGKEIEFFDPESDYVFEVRQAEEGGWGRMGRHLFCRLAYEFCSPAWLLRLIEERLGSHDAGAENAAANAQRTVT
ncbi:hypothetical protein [Pseudophaeobacter sp. EL27]|uniref:hypothetical protein n=1 Tax=Pseudophaeobacter sp. EL27 TaxID=2107580 RepID=UPI000EFD71BA|nr:hypothetical protein [Pseudophaeobacter sp. EL27]